MDVVHGAQEQHPPQSPVGHTTAVIDVTILKEIQALEVCSVVGVLTMAAASTLGGLHSGQGRIQDIFASCRRQLSCRMP
jgi:hypothetical protein